MPTESDQRRSDLQVARYMILTEQHDEIVREWRAAHMQQDVDDSLGPSDLSANPLAEICRQLSTPGLYGRTPTTRHSDPAGAALVGPDGALATAGYWSRMQRVQYFALGMGEQPVRLDVDADGQLTVRLVSASDLYVVPDDEHPDRARVIWELRLRPVPGKPREVRYVWEQYSIPRPGSDEQPYYRIVEAAQSGPGEDLSEVYLTRADGTRGALEGDAYPYRYANGRPFLPWVFYRAQDTGQFWNHLDRRGVHHGTLMTAMFYTFASHTAHAASGNMAIAWGLEPMGDVVKQPDGTVKAISSRSLNIMPRTLLFARRTDAAEQPDLRELGAGGNLTALSEWVRSYEMRQSLRWGLAPADVTRQHANPTSGAALTISRADKREAMEQVEEVFRRVDVEAMGKAAALLRDGGDRRYGALPDQGYTISYQRISESPDEARARREHIEWMQSQGHVSELDAYCLLHPGATKNDAIVARTMVAVDAALAEAHVRQALVEAGLAPDVAGGAGAGDGKAQDTALNGAQVQAAQSIVQAVASGQLPRETGVTMLVLFFQIDQSDADRLMGDVGGSFRPTVAEPPPQPPQPADPAKEPTP
jgi:hypothetical protein